MCGNILGISRLLVESIDWLELRDILLQVFLGRMVGESKSSARRPCRKLASPGETYVRLLHGLLLDKV